MIILTIGFADVCSEPCGSNTLMALGETIVDVIMKNINNRNIRSVIDDMLNVGDIFCLLFSDIGIYYFSLGSFSKSIKAMVRASI